MSDATTPRVTTERARELLVGAADYDAARAHMLVMRDDYGTNLCCATSEGAHKPNCAALTRWQRASGASGALADLAPDLAADLIAARAEIARLTADLAATRELRVVPVEEHARAVREAWMVFCRPLYADRGRAASDADIAEHWRECDTRTRLIARLVGSGLTEARSVALADGAA